MKERTCAARLKKIFSVTAIFILGVSNLLESTQQRLSFDEISVQETVINLSFFLSVNFLLKKRKLMADWGLVRRLWDRWVSHNIGSSDEPLKAALLINYDPNAPSRLLSVISEQEGVNYKAIELKPFLDFVKRHNWQKEFFCIGPNQYLVTSIHEHWFCARCINTSKTSGEGVIVMQIAAYLLVAMYDGSIGSASRAMVAVDQLSWQLSQRNHSNAK